MKGKRFLFSGLIAILLLFGLIAPQAAEAKDIIVNATTTLSFDPAAATATTCGIVDVNVRVNDVVDLTAFHLEITYDRTKVQVVEVVNGGFLTAPGEDELFEPTNTVDNGSGTGRILWGMAQQGVDGNPVPKSGSGNLITIRLKSLAVAGATTLEIDGTNSMLVDWPEAQAISYSVDGPATITLQSCAPTDITLSNAAVDENQPVGTVVGTLSATDPDPADTIFEYSLVNLAGYPDNASFQIVGDQLQTNAIFDYEAETSYQINVRVTGPHGLTYDDPFTITVNDVNDAPVLVAIGAKSVVNTETLAFTASASDEDLPAQTLTFSVKDAPTGATINATTGAFSWDPTVSTDAGTYYATICVSDELLEDCEIITITVTDGEAPTIVSGVAHGVAPYTNVTADSALTFTVPQGYVVSTIDFTISEPVTIVGSNIVYLGTVPYGTMVAVDNVVTVTPYPGNEIAAQLGTVTFNIDANSIEDLAGNALTPLSATLIVTDQTDPVMELVTPAEGLITLGLDDTFILTVDAFDLNLYSLEIDHSFGDNSLPPTDPLYLPEFTVYASTSNPWGSQEAKDGFDYYHMTVAYNEATQKWTIDFGEDITDTHFIPTGVTFYMVLKDEAGNTWGSMDPTNGDNTFAYTFEVTNTLEPEITSAVTYVYPDPTPYDYVGDIVFDDPNNIFTATYSPAEFLAGGAMNDLARYLGALYRQDTSTIIKITFNGVEYTWDETSTLKGSRWEDSSGNTLVSAMVAYYFSTSYDPAVGMPITVHDGWHEADVTFKLVITNTLDEELESAPDYVYDPVYTYVGTRVFDDEANIYTVTYDDVDFDPNAMYDLARYLGALYRQDGSTVVNIEYDGVTYTWDPEVGLLGSNWADASGTTLVSVVVAGIGGYDPLTGLVFTLSDGVHTENVTFKFVVLDTTSPVLTITGAVAGSTPMAGDLATGYFLPTTNNPAIDHLLQFADDTVSSEALADEYFGLYFVETESTVTAEELKAYYDARGVPSEPLDFLGYLKGAADGTNPFVYIKGTGLSLSLVDAAKYDLMDNNVAMTVPDTFPLGTYVVRGIVEDPSGNETTVTLTLIVTGDRVAPTIVSGVAIGAGTLDDVTMVGTTFTVPQGYTVEKIEITMSEAVQIVAPGIVYFEGNPYGTMTATGSVVTITPYAGNETAGIPGTFDFTIDAGSITDLAGNALATLAATMVVEPSPIFNMTDFGPWGETWPGAYNLGWGYVPLFDTTTIASIEVGMLDAARESIVTYTADDEQIVWQLANGWIPTPPANLSSAPFYRVYNGDPIVEGEGEDWTVIFGESFDDWSPRWGYVKVTDIYGTVVYHEMEYTGTLGDLTAPEVEAAVAIGADPFEDVTAVGLTFTVPEGYTVETIEFTMSEPVTVVTGTEVTLAGVPYGLVTVSADGLTLIVTPYPGNTVANLTGTFIFDVPEGKIFDLSGNPLGTLSATMIVMPALAVTDADLYYGTDPAVIDQALDGSFADGFVMELDPLVPWYYLDTDVITSNNDLAEGMYPFYLSPDTTTPVFYLNVDELGELSLIDGWLYLNRSETSPLRINGDFAPGTYTYGGELEDIYGSTAPLSIEITFVNALEVTDADLYYGADPLVIDQPLDGTFADGFTMVLDPMVPWYYLDTEVITSNNDLANGRYTFYESSDMTQPVFYLDVAAGDFSLIDAYNWLVDGVVSPLRINGDFTPGTYTYVGEVTDIYGSTAPLSITITFNDVPYATAQSVTVVEDTATAITLSGVDLFPGTMTYAVVTPPTHGTLSGTAPALTYTPAADYYGTDSFTFTVSDGTLTSTPATVSITVTSVLDAPTVSSTNLPGPYMVGLEQEFQVTLTNPDNGDDFTNVLARFRLEDITLADIASFQYLETSVDPDAWMPLPLTQDGTGVIGDFGPATGFPMAAPYSATSQFKVTFNTAGTYPATIVLYDVAADPDVELDSYEADVVVVADFEVTDVVLTRSVDQTTWVNVPGNFTDGFAMPLNTSEDYYYFDVSTLTATRPLVDGSYPFYLTETPGAEFFAYWAAKGVMEGATDWQGLMWDIINGDAPMFYLKVEGTNYSLIDGLQGEPNLLRINGDYYPGAYAFSGIVEDEYGFTDEVPVDIIFNDIPVAIAQTVTTDEDTAVAILLEAVDLYPGTLSWSVVNPANGTLSGYAPSLTYTPDADWNGSDSFTFSVNDGTLGSNTATVTINVTSVNDAPVAVEETYSTSFETALTVSAPGVLANDTEVELDPLTAVMVSDVTNGTLVLAADGSFVYTPDPAFVGVDTFTYKANDGTLDSNIVTVSITVTSYVNNPPVAVADTYETDQNVELVIGILDGVLDNDYDVDGDELTATLKTNVTNGVLVLKGDGSFTYTPKADFCGTDSFVYTLVSYPNINNNGWTAEATATITVYCDAIISSDDLDGPFYVGNQQEFHVTLTNHEYGHDFTNVLARFRLEDITLADIASFQYLETSVEPDVWMDLPLSQDGTDVIGDFGPAAGFPMGAPYSATSQFKVNFNTAGIHPGSIVLYDVAIDPAEAIASYSDTMVVAGLNAQDFGYMYFSDVMGVSAGFLPVNFTLDMADLIVVELFSGPETAYELLQTNTAISPAAMAAWTQFSGPFDIFGTFDYVADGVWTNVRESEYGQTEIPTRVLATVTLPGGITLTAENTNLTGERGYIIDTLDEELASAPEYDYSPPYVPVGDVDFDLTSNTYTGTYTAPQVLAGSPMNDMARYLGALYRQPDSTISSIVYNGTTYTWDTTGTLVGSNWEDSTGKTLISQVTDDFLAAVAAGTWDPDAGFVMTVHDDYGHSATVTFLLVILNTLDAEIASAPDYDYDPVYTWVGNWAFDDPANIYTLTYDDTTFAPGAMNDLARYLGALYRQNGATVAAIVYDGTTYTWQIIGNELKGSNWRDASGTTLMSVITADVLAGEVDPDTGLILTLSDVFHTENVNFKLVINDTIAPMLGAITAFGADGFDDLLAIGTTITVDQGYTVDHTEVVVNEPVIVADGTVVTLAGQPYGTITVDETGLILIITPYPGNEIANLAGSFVFSAPNGTITDLSGNPLETLSLTLIVNNVAPVAVADAYTTLEDTVLTVAAPGVLANDVDYDVLSATLIGDVSNGSLTFKPDGGFEYTPALNWHGTDTFTYKANDGSADSEIVTVSITVTDEKDQVQAVDDAYETNEGETLTVAAPGVLFNDIDVDMNIMTAGLVTDVAHGQLTLNGDGSFVYIPDADFYGTDSFEYQLVTYPAPMSLWTDIAEVTITVHQISGTIEPDGGTGQIPGGTLLTITNVGDNVSYLGEIAWYPADASVGRTAGNRVGVEINAPAGFDTSNTTFTVFGSTYNWDNVKDGDNFIWIYPKVTEVPQNWEIVVAWNPGATQTFTVDVLTGSTLQAPKLGTIERDPGNTGDVPGGTPLAVSQVGDAISFAGEVAWYPADLSAGRTEGNRVGVQVNAPAGFDTTNTTFTVFGSTYSWDAVNDGDNFVWIYPKVTEIPQSWDIVVTWEAGNVQTFTVEVLTGSTIDDRLALEWLQDNTVLSSITGMVDDLTATFPASIPEVIVAEDYVIDSRMNLADPLPAGSTVTVFRDGIQILTDITLDGIGPFWFTELFDPDAPRADFDAGYGGADEEYEIVVTGPGGDPLDFDTTVLIESVISKDGFTTETVLDDITLGIHIPADESAALEWLQDNTVLSSVSGMVDDLTATFPSSIPPVIVAEDYVIDSRMTLAAPLPMGSTVTVFRDGVQILTDITLNGVGPFWFTQLFEPDAPRAAFDANYGGQVEEYSIIVTGPGGLPADFDTTVLIESVISKDSYVTETVLDDITLGIHLDDGTAPSVGSGVARSASDGDVNLVDGKFTVNQGYTVDTIEITMNEPVLVDLGTVITMEGYGPYGTITSNVNGVVTITPYSGNETAALIGTFTFTAPQGTITDLAGNAFTGNIRLIVLNVAPVAVADTYTVAEDGVLTVTTRGVLINDTDYDPAILTAVKVTDPANGTLVLNADGSFTYTPAADFNGTDIFTYKANDGHDDSNVATVTITVTPVNDAPVAIDDEYTVAEKAVLTIAAPGILANDSDVDGDDLTAILVDDVSDGTLTLNADGSFVYTPNEYFNGTDSFTYLASDGTLQSELATVTITVTPVNDWPIANDDFYETLTGVMLDVAAPGVLGNDVLLDPDEEVSIQILDAPQHGTLSMNDDGAFTYTPDAGFMGTDTFRYLVTSVQVNAEWNDDAMVTIVVKPFQMIHLPLIFK